MCPAIALTTKTVYIKDENSSQTNFRLAPIYFSAPCGKTRACPSETLAAHKAFPMREKHIQ